MIDDKKKEEAARRNADKYRDCPTLSDEDRDKVSIGSFKDGANWAINKFLKDLWHPTGEAPKRGRLIIVENDGKIGRHYTIQINDYYSWESFTKGANITRWLYISDLLPKEGGE